MLICAIVSLIARSGNAVLAVWTVWCSAVSYYHSPYSHNSIQISLVELKVMKIKMKIQPKWFVIISITTLYAIAMYYAADVNDFNLTVSYRSAVEFHFIWISIQIQMYIIQCRSLLNIKLIVYIQYDLNVRRTLWLLLCWC